jgi:hypothetical protein
MARKLHNKPHATGAGVEALKATMLASVAALDARTVSRGTAFRGLDRIDIALSDVMATAAVLDEIIVNMTVNMTEGKDHEKVEAIDTLFRHLQSDLTALQNANKEARVLILGAPRIGGAA